VSRRTSCLGVVLLCGLTSASAAGAPAKEPSFGKPVLGLRLGLELPLTNAPICGGLCGLVHGSKVEAKLLVENLLKQSQRVALELTCSGHEADLMFARVRQPGEPAKAPPPMRVGLQKNLSCRANAPRFRTLAPGEVVRLALPFTVPALPPAMYDVTARLKVFPEKGPRFELTSAPVRRPVHK
jgi:hypothetical protein